MIIDYLLCQWTTIKCVYIRGNSFLNQAHAWFLNIVSVWMSVCVCVCLRVHVSASEAIY